MNFESELQQVAKRYQDEGYQVIVRPRGDQLPPFAADFGADLIASKDAEKVLVSVKESRKDLRSEPPISRIAEAVNAQPGWRLDLVILKPDGNGERIAPDAREPTRADILQALDHAERMARAGEVASAVLIAWSGLEAAMRQAAASAGVDLRGAKPAVMIRSLYASGLLSRDEFDRLEGASKVRNSVAHGFILPRIDDALPATVANVARRLLAGEQQLAPTGS